MYTCTVTVNGQAYKLVHMFVALLRLQVDTIKQFAAIAQLEVTFTDFTKVTEES